MTQTAKECFDEWSEAFLKVIELMGEAADPVSAAECLASEDEWFRTGAYDGRAFYNSVGGAIKAIDLAKTKDYRSKYFYLKHTEWSRHNPNANKAQLFHPEDI